MASVAWVSLLLALCLALLGPTSGIHQDRVLAVIAIFMNAVHWGSESRLRHRI